MRRLALVALLVPVLAACSGEEREVEPVNPVRMVTVRLVTQTDVIHAYERLQRLGLLVAIRNGFSAHTLCVPIAQRQSPRSGLRVPAGTVATFGAGWCPLGSPIVTRASAIVPDLTGRSVSDALDWAGRRGLYWEARELPPLPPSGRPRLFDNYTVVRQEPAPGSRLLQGVKGGKGFRPTPLVVYARVRR